MKMRRGTGLLFFALFLLAWGHNLVPHSHEVLSSSGHIERTASEPHHHHHDNSHHHHHGPSSSWLDWLLNQFGSFNHSDFGEKHLEIYYAKHLSQELPLTPHFNAVPGFFLFANQFYSKQLAAPRPFVSTARAPDKPEVPVQGGRAPPSFS